MKKIVIHAGFHPEQERVYRGETIYKVTDVRGNIEGRDYHTGMHLNDRTNFYRLDNGDWIKDLGQERYVTDWTGEERWGRAEEVEYAQDGTIISQKDLGFVILRVDRANGLL